MVPKHELVEQLRKWSAHAGDVQDRILDGLREWVTHGAAGAGNMEEAAPIIVEALGQNEPPILQAVQDAVQAQIAQSEAAEALGRSARDAPVAVLSLLLRALRASMVPPFVNGLAAGCVTGVASSARVCRLFANEHLMPENRELEADWVLESVAAARESGIRLSEEGAEALRPKVLALLNSPHLDKQVLGLVVVMLLGGRLDGQPLRTRVEELAKSRNLRLFVLGHMAIELLDMEEEYD